MNIQGWDTIYCISVDQVNGKLRENADRLPHRFQAASQPGDSLTYNLAAQSGAWQLQRGQGALFTLAISFTSGTFTVAQAGSADISGVTIGIDVDLRLLPSSIPGSRDVAFQFAAPKSTKTGSIISGGEKLDIQHRTFLPFVLAQYLAMHAGAITYALATINPGKPGISSWLSPVQSTFTLLTDAVSGRLFLAVLNSLTQRDVSRLSTAVDLSLPAGTDAVLALSTDVMMQNMLLPACKSAYGTQNFSFSTGDHTIHQTNGFGLPSVKSGLIWYSPSANAFRASLNGNKLVTHVDGSCDLKASLSMTFWVEAACPFAFDRTHKTLGFAQDGSPRQDHSVDAPWYLKYLLPFVLPIAAAVTAIVVTVIGNDLAGKISSALSSVAKVDDMLAMVNWTGLKQPQLTDARLDGALIMTGNFQ
jgi:hypothetical protein